MYMSLIHTVIGVMRFDTTNQFDFELTFDLGVYAGSDIRSPSNVSRNPLLVRTMTRILSSDLGILTHSVMISDSRYF